MGIDLPVDRIFTSGWAAARYVVERKPNPEVFIAGGDALHREMTAVGAVGVHRRNLSLPDRSVVDDSAAL